VSRRAGRPSKPRIDQVAPHEWLSIRVELVEGRGANYWPRPGRLVAAAPIHSFAQLATTIDSASRDGTYRTSINSSLQIARKSGDLTRTPMMTSLTKDARDYPASDSASNLSMCSTLATTGRIYAQSAT